MPARAFSTYVILLDFQQGRCGSGNYCAHRHGGLAAMRGWNGKTCNGQVSGFEASRFEREDVEPITMTDRVGNPLPGTIAKLSYSLSLAPNVMRVLP